MNKEEDRMLKEKSRKCCLTEAAYLRFLIQDVVPKEKPGDEFYTAMRPLYSISNSLNQLVAKAHTLGFIDEEKLKIEIKKLHEFQAAIEDKAWTNVKE